MKLGWIRYGLEELKFLKTFQDLRLFYKQKLPFIITRIKRNPVRDHEVPPSLQIEPTNHCDLNCISCSRDKSKRKKGYMDYNLFRKIIDDASKIGVRRIHLYLHGEPMLHPRIIDMIENTKSRGIGVTMATNGMLLDEEKIKMLLKSGVNSSDLITFSILGYSREVHERIMKGVDHYRVLKNISNFLKLRKEFKINGPVVETVFYQMPENKHEARKFSKYWQSVVDHVHPVGEISKQFANYKADDIVIPVRKRTCNNLWERMTIFWNGDVSICCADLDGDFIFGNLENKEIVELWNCEALSRIRNIHRQKEFAKLKLCLMCDW